MRGGAIVLAAVLAAAVAAGCGNDVDDAGAEWPRRDVKIMAPADPGGGWDTTAREMARIFEERDLIPKSVEVYNVSGAGGTIGLAQLAARRPPPGGEQPDDGHGARDARRHRDQPGAARPRRHDADRRAHLGA